MRLDFPRKHVTDGMYTFVAFSPMGLPVYSRFLRRACILYNGPVHYSIVKAILQPSNCIFCNGERFPSDGAVLTVVQNTTEVFRVLSRLHSQNTYP